MDRAQKVVDLAGLCLNQELDTPVRQVSYIAPDVKAAGDGLAGIAEPHSLHPAREIDSATYPRHAYCPCGDLPMQTRPKGEIAAINFLSYRLLRHCDKPSRGGTPDNHRMAPPNLNESARLAR